MSNRAFRWQLAVVGSLFAAACAAGDRSSVDGTEGAEPSNASNAPPLGDSAPSAELEAILQQRYEARLAEKKFNQISGHVTDIEGNPLNGVTVSAGGKVVKTNRYGRFTLPELPFNVYVVSLEHPDYVFSQRVVPAWYGNEPYLTPTMLPRRSASTFNADELVEVEQGPLKLTFEPGDLVLAATGVAVHGEVTITATPIEPGREGHIAAAPAELEGLDEGGQITGLDSFGMFEVELTQKGRRVQVRPGETVGVHMRVPRLAGVKGGATIPMWHHDTDLGIWVQEAGLRADVREEGGVLVATTEVPHFSAWNLDGPKQSLCVAVRFPGALGFRSVSTTPAGTLDSLWSVTGECQEGRCVTNAPSGFTLQENVSFKFQVLVPTTNGSSTVNQWCDLRLVMNQGTNLVLYGDTLEEYSKKLNSAAPESSFCGTYNTFSGSITVSGAYNSYRNGTFGVPLPAYDANSNGNVAEDLYCPPGWQATSLPLPDTGFGKMSTNAQLLAFYKDFDRDSQGISDTADSCPGSSNNTACGVNCYVAPGPSASTWDKDLDRIDDFCDSKMYVYNPSQYNGL